MNDPRQEDTPSDVKEDDSKSDKEKLAEAAVEESGQLKFATLAVSRIWEDALLLIPVVAWNTVLIKLIDAVYPAAEDKYRNLWAGVIYASVVTLIVIIIYYIYLRSKRRAELKNNSNSTT